MSKLTKKYIIKSGVKVSKSNKHNSITVQYANKAQFDRMLRKVKYQSRWCTYSTGYPLRLNFDIEVGYNDRKEWRDYENKCIKELKRALRL